MSRNVNTVAGNGHLSPVEIEAAFLASAHTRLYINPVVSYQLCTSLAASKKLTSPPSGQGTRHRARAPLAKVARRPDLARAPQSREYPQGHLSLVQLV